MALHTGTDASLVWRTNGQSGTVGHVATFAETGNLRGTNSTPVITDSSGIIEYKFSDAGSHTAYLYTDGFYLPIGM
jgi:hypothetical protein